MLNDSYKKGYLKIAVVIASVLFIGYTWGDIIQTNRSTFRTPYNIEYYVTELIMYLGLFLMIYLQRDMHFGGKFRPTKFIAFNTFFLIMFIHIVNTYLLS